MKYPFQPVRDYEVQAGLAKGLVEDMRKSGGFQASQLGKGAEILDKIWYDDDCTSMLSFTADIVSTGVRGVIRQVVREGLVDVIITTCGTLDHDIARSLGNYLEGDFMLDDADLLKKGFHRLGNIVIPKENYGPSIERFMQELLKEKYSDASNPIPPHQLIWEAGKSWMKNRFFTGRTGIRYL